MEIRLAPAPIAKTGLSCWNQYCTPYLPQVVHTHHVGMTSGAGSPLNVVLFFLSGCLLVLVYRFPFAQEIAPVSPPKTRLTTTSPGPDLHQVPTHQVHTASAADTPGNTHPNVTCVAGFGIVFTGGTPTLHSHFLPA